MILVPVSITLLALSTGMFLLAKANKDNLGVFYKIVAYFIIVASFLNLACCAMHCAMQFYDKKFEHEIMMQKKNDFKENDIGYDHNMERDHRDHNYFYDGDKKSCMECYARGYSDGFCKKEYTEQKDSSYIGHMDKKEKK